MHPSIVEVFLYFFIARWLQIELETVHCCPAIIQKRVRSANAALNDCISSTDGMVTHASSSLLKVETIRWMTNLK
jgi:hypothetical protein